MKPPISIKTSKILKTQAQTHISVYVYIACARMNELIGAAWYLT